MPNWCYNTLLIEAEPQVIAKIKAQLSAPYERKTQDLPSFEWKTETVEKLKLLAFLAVENNNTSEQFSLDLKILL